MKNATVVVIGGLSGIGRAVAEQAAAAGARVIAAGRRAAPGDFPATIETAQIDVGDAASVAQFFDSVGAFDHLVVTAGPVIASAKLADLNVADAIAAFNVKFFGQLRVAQAAIGTIKPTGSITSPSSRPTARRCAASSSRSPAWTMARARPSASTATGCIWMVSRRCT